MSEGSQQRGKLVGDLISISSAPAVVSLSEVEGIRDGLAAGEEAGEELASLLSGYSLGEPEARAAFEAMVRSLGRREERGDAFLISGVYGSGKSHLLAALTLLAGHPNEAWPAFLASHPGYDRLEAAFQRPRLVVAIALDEYPAQSHPLEHIVLSRIEAELARRHGVRVALTEESHLLDLVDRYVVTQVGDSFEEAARRSHGAGWSALRQREPAKAAEVALAFLEESGFPLNWRRSRAEAWGALRRALEGNGIDGPVVLLDELGVFLAAKDRRGLNADASFLQYVAQRTAGERCWLVVVTQRGLEEVGDVDRRTLRQLRDRFRPSFTLSLAELGWVVQHRLVQRRSPETFAQAMGELHSRYSAGGEPFSAAELARSYPLNPLCLTALQRAAETCLSQTRSAVRLLQEAVSQRGWLEQPAARLITLDVVFDVFQDEIALSASGRKHLHAYGVVMANASRIAPGREQQLSAVMKALCLLGVGELRWSVRQLRASLVGCEEAELWRSPGDLEEMLAALYRRGVYVERARGDGEETDEYFVDASSEVSERIRQRLNELVKELTPTGQPADSRVARLALEACREEAFPLAGLAEPRSLGVEWWRARRQVALVCRDLSELTPGELQNLAGSLEAAATREDGWLLLASPSGASADQEKAWREGAAGFRGRFAAGLLAWLPRELSGTERDQLAEHAALSRMVSDPTVARPRDRELRAKLRERWEDSAGQAGRMLQRAYYEGRMLNAAGEEVMEAERLSGLMGQWEETLATAFAGSFRKLFPHFPSVAPERRLAGRAQTNQIVDQFIRPAEVSLPPASTLEAHLIAYAAPLGLVEGEDGHYRLALRRGELVEAVLAATPARESEDEADPSETITYLELAGRLAKSEWGITREQSELLLAAMIRTGYLVALDAFLQPAPGGLEAIAAPLAENLPYLARGVGLGGPTGEAARSLWAAATGRPVGDWDLPAQERAWGELVAWSTKVRESEEQWQTALARAAEAFGQAREEWAWVEEALARARALAAQAAGIGMPAPHTSRAGLARLVGAAERLPGGLPGAEQALERWRQCQRFLSEECSELARLGQLLWDQRVTCPEGSLLAREREALREQFRSSSRLVSATAEVRSSALRWLEAYRKHYLAWHGTTHAAARSDGLAKLARSATMEAARRLARAGLPDDDVAAVEGELARALGKRCLAGDPLPAGSAVCPQCGTRLGEGVTLPEASEMAERAAEGLARQRQALAGHAELLRRRLEGCSDQRIATAVGQLLAGAEKLAAQALTDLLTEELIAWLSAQLGQPKAQRRQWRELEERLRGKEMPKREVVRRVEEWLGGGEDEVVGIE